MTDPILTPELRSGLDPDDLLVYAPGLQSLAARLVGIDLAEDLLQDTWVRALEKPPQAQQPLGPWLVRVLSNLAISSYRRRSRRSDQECALHESQQLLNGSPTPDEVGAKTEAAERVMGAVSDLDELPRKIISLRYLRGMASGQIGEALELPASTVRWHIQNSVAKMRVSLAEEGRDLPDGWVACLVPLIPLTDPGAMAQLGFKLSAKLGAGSSAGLGAKGAAAAAVNPLVAPVLVASVLAAFIGVMAQLFMGQAVAPSLQAPLITAIVENTALPLSAARAQVPAVLPAIAAPEASRQVAAVPAALATEAASLVDKLVISAPHNPADRHQDSPSLESEEGSLKVQICSRIVGEDRSPLSGAEIALASAMGGFAVSGSDGELRLAMAGTPGMMGLMDGFDVSAPGHATRHVTWPLWIGTQVRLGDLNLAKSRPLTGFVGDTEGNAIAGVSVTASSVGSEKESSPVLTDDKGRFQLPEVPSEQARVTAKIAGFRPGTIHPVDHFEGQLKLELKREEEAPTLALLVLDPSGLPVSGATVSLRRAGYNRVTLTADKNGQVRVPLSASPGNSSGEILTGDVTAFDPAFAFAPTKRQALPLDGQQHILKLNRGCTLKFLVKSRIGAQSLGFRWFHPESIHHPSATIRHGEVSRSNELIIAIAADSASTGSEEGIVILAEGFEPVSFEFRNAAKGSGPIELLLCPEKSVDVHVVQGMAPVKGATVTVSPTHGGPLSYGDVGSILGASIGKTRTYKTDALGAFHIPQHAFEPLTLRVNAPGLAPWFYHHPGTGAAVDLKTIPLEPGGTLVGRTPAAYASRQSVEATHQNGDIEIVSATAAPFYQMHGLAPGTWTVRWIEQGATGASAEVQGRSSTVEIAPGDVTYLDR